MAGTWLDPLEDALEKSPRGADFFFRDDDVGWRDDRLWPLLELFGGRALPVDLAVIPKELDRALAHRLLEWVRCAPRRIGVHQHGFAHVNHEATGRKYEFGASRPMPVQHRDISEGKRHLELMLGPTIDPIFTPPWNRCTPATGACLVDLGFRVLSRESRAVPLNVPGLEEIPVRVDWFAHEKGKRLTRPEMGAVLAAAVEERAPVGVMFHHAVMDAGERRDAGDLLTLLSGHPGARAHSIVDLQSRQALEAGL